MNGAAPSALPREPGQLALLSNTASGANRRHGVDATQALAAAAGVRLRHVTRDLDGLAPVLRDWARAGVRCIIVNGGDGTVCGLIDRLRGARCFTEEPALALLRGGTTNMIHRDVGWPGSPAGGLRALLAALPAGAATCCQRQVLEVRQAGQLRHGFFFATNALVRAIQGTRERLHRRGFSGRASEFLGIAATCWRLLRQRAGCDPVLRPVALAVARDGGDWRTETHVFLIAVTLRRMLLAARPLAADQHAACTALHWPHDRLAPWLWQLWRGRLPGFDALALCGTFDWVLDGEIHRQYVGDPALRVAPGRAVRFVVGKSRP